MMMDGQKPTAADVIPIVQSWIDELGVEAAFKIVGRLLLYSGPRRSISNVFNKFDRNHDRAASWALSGKYTIIDQTEIAHRLRDFEGNGVYSFFHALFGEEKDADGKLKRNISANAVMSFASQAYIFAAKGEVEALVCGADFRGVFYKTELPALMKNKNISSINGVAIDRLREIYFSDKKDATYQTFRKICQGGLAQARARIVAANSFEEKSDLRQEYLIDRTYFMEERRETLGIPKALAHRVVPDAQLFLPIYEELTMPVPRTAPRRSHSHQHGARFH